MKNLINPTRVIVERGWAVVACHKHGREAALTGHLVLKYNGTPEEDALVKDLNRKVGMNDESLKDKFAGMAMQGMLASGLDAQGYKLGHLPDFFLPLAKSSYMAAEGAQ